MPAMKLRLLGMMTLMLALMPPVACAAPAQVTVHRDPEPSRSRAALSTVFVENRTQHRLSISYRLATRSGSEVVVGTAPPDSVIRLAPLPAGEPLMLLARTQDGRQISVGPRSFLIETEWTWLIDATARFVQPPEDL
jgi:hypothetical protein